MDTEHESAQADQADQAASASADALLEANLTGYDEGDLTGSSAGDAFVGAENADILAFEGNVSGNALDSQPDNPQDLGSEQPAPSEAAALANAKQALDRIGLDSSALQESLSKEDFFEAGRKAEAHHSSQTKEFERIRAESQKAIRDEDADDDSASDYDEPGSVQEDSELGQPDESLDIDALMQPFAEIDPEASEALTGVLRPLLEQTAAAANQAAAANNAILAQTVASVRRDLGKQFHELAQPDVWAKIDAKAQELAASGGKYLEPSTLQGRVELAIRDARTMVTSPQSTSSSASSSPGPSGRSHDDSPGYDPLDAQIMGFLDG